jgi:hypothetical protein
MRHLSRFLAAITLSVTLVAGSSLALPAVAGASHGQVAIIQDGPPLMSDPVGTLAEFRALGATTVRVIMFWSSVAPDPTSSTMPADFNASDPDAYPAAGWAPYDQIVRDAKQAGITVDFTVAGGAPVWADGSGIPPQGKNPHFAWKPNPRLYGQFVQAVGERYDGSFPDPQNPAQSLPAVRSWALWNEPNFGQDLGPQAIDGSTVSVAPMMYRNLVSAGWNALQQTGHGHDKILIGEFAARGLSGKPNHNHPQGLPGNYSQTKPLQFIRTLYCVGANYKALSGRYARARGCPASAAGSRRFRAQNPGLFNAGGVGDHPYPGGQSPVDDAHADPDIASFPELGNLERVLDKVNRIYGSHKRYSIFSDEYGYITSPPQTAPYVSPATAAYYLNWSEYLSWKSPRVASYAQYLLDDPEPPGAPRAGFASGLFTFNGTPKATYYAYRLPLYLPQTSLRRGRGAEVWGDVRPAHFMALDSTQPQTVAIQLRAGGHGAFQTVKTVAVSDSNGYFDVQLAFGSGGDVRLAYTYPETDPLLPVGIAGTTSDSRLVKIKLH